MARSTAFDESAFVKLFHAYHKCADEITEPIRQLRVIAHQFGFVLKCETTKDGKLELWLSAII